jgi:hypothetical protein
VPLKRGKFFFIKNRKQDKNKGKRKTTKNKDFPQKIKTMAKGFPFYLLFSLEIQIGLLIIFSAFSLGKRKLLFALCPSVRHSF